MKIIEELHELWLGQLSDLTDAIMNRVIALYPMTQDDVNCPVVWTKEADNFKATLPVIGAAAWFIIDPGAVILHSNRRWPQYYLPSVIKAAILELYPEWICDNNVASPPVVDIRQIVDTGGAPFGNWFDPGVNVIYQITFESGVTIEMLVNTNAYQHPTINVNQYGRIL